MGNNGLDITLLHYRNKITIKNSTPMSLDREKGILQREKREGSEGGARGRGTHIERRGTKRQEYTIWDLLMGTD